VYKLEMGSISSSSLADLAALLPSTMASLESSFCCELLASELEDLRLPRMEALLELVLAVVALEMRADLRALPESCSVLVVSLDCLRDLEVSLLEDLSVD
jgi:hypothetical protein